MIETKADRSDGPAGEAELLGLFAENAIAYTYNSHPPLFTVEDSRKLRGNLRGAHVKNMFLKDKKGGLWLVTCLEHRRVRIRDLEREIGAKGCSFAREDVLWEALGVRPGAVTPFALINDPERKVQAVLDKAVLNASFVNAHPLQNEATVAISSYDLERFFTIVGHAPLLVDFDALEERAPAPAAER